MNTDEDVDATEEVEEEATPRFMVPGELAGLAHLITFLDEADLPFSVDARITDEAGVKLGVVREQHDDDGYVFELDWS